MYAKFMLIEVNMASKKLFLFGFFAFFDFAASKIPNHCLQGVPCDNCQCIEREEWCNGHKRCADGSDEKYCQEKTWYGSDPNNCASTHFLCSNGHCVPTSVECDTYDDCKDGSDEKNCDTDIPTEFFPTMKTLTTIIAWPEPPRRATPSVQWPTQLWTPFNPRTTTIPEPTNRWTPSPRGPVYPQTTTTSTFLSPLTRPGPPILTPSIYIKRVKSLDPFYFAKNYTSIYHSRYADIISKAVQWLLSTRDSNGGWGRDTSRALIALSLVNNSFVSGVQEHDLMKKHFQVLIGQHLLRVASKPIHLSRQAIHINALLATCQNPTNFYGLNLAENLRQQVASIAENRHATFINPLVYLSLCLVDQELSMDIINILRQMIRPSEHFDEEAKDMQSLAAIALACYSHQQALRQPYRNSLDVDIRQAVSEILQRQKHDGSFGNIYTTALTAQALMSFNSTGDWNPTKTLDFLADHQQSDGSFGDLLATYYILPVLSGRSLVYLRNTLCVSPIISEDLSPEEILDYPGPKHYIRYSLHYGNPLRNSLSVLMHLPVGIQLFDAMRVAEYISPDFKFAYEENQRNIYVYSFSNIPNDSERGFSWYLYVKKKGSDDKKIDQRELFTGHIREYIPSASDHIVFWYYHIRTL